jgi:hypothetical protein
MSKPFGHDNNYSTFLIAAGFGILVIIPMLQGKRPWPFVFRMSSGCNRFDLN